MRETVLIIILIIANSCNQPTQNLFDTYSITVSDNQYYTYNLKSGEYRIAFLGFIDTIPITENQKLNISKLFFQNHIDTLIGRIDIYPEEVIMMPDDGDQIRIETNNSEKSILYISGQGTENSELNQQETRIIKFKNELFQILNTNDGYRRCMDTLRKNYNKLPPLM